jgi:hypothetical protein
MIQMRIAADLIDLLNSPQGFLSSVLAYLDPGSGSYLLQLLVAAALGGLLLLRLYWSKVKSFLRRVFTGREDEPDIDE